MQTFASVGFQKSLTGCLIMPRFEGITLFHSRKDVNQSFCLARGFDDFRNSVNRQVNCDTANIEKQLNAAKTQIEAIKYLEKTGRMEALTSDLRETADLRLANSQLSYSDLGKLMEPKVSKSGVRR